MSFLANYVGGNLRALHDGLVKTLVSFDPEGASEAQLAEYGDKVHQLADIAAKAEQQAQSDEAEVGRLATEATRHVQAVELLEAQIAATADPAAKAAKQKGLDKVSHDAESLVSQLEAAKAAARDSRAYAEEMKAAHKAAADKWASGRQRLDQARREQERARVEADRARERQAEMERAKGLTSGLDAADVALDAMAANTAKFKRQAEAAKLTTGALSAASEGDDEAARALAAVSGAPAAPGAATSASLKERLAALKG